LPTEEEKSVEREQAIGLFTLGLMAVLVVYRFSNTSDYPIPLIGMTLSNTFVNAIIDITVFLWGLYAFLMVFCLAMDYYMKLKDLAHLFLIISFSVYIFFTLIILAASPYKYIILLFLVAGVIIYVVLLLIKKKIHFPKELQIKNIKLYMVAMSPFHFYDIWQ
jgi:hypothetical protein